MHKPASVSVSNLRIVDLVSSSMNGTVDASVVAIIIALGESATITTAVNVSARGRTVRQENTLIVTLVNVDVHQSSVLQGSKWILIPANVNAPGSILVKEDRAGTVTAALVRQYATEDAVPMDTSGMMMSVTADVL